MAKHYEALLSFPNTIHTLQETCHTATDAKHQIEKSYSEAQIERHLESKDKLVPTEKTNTNKMES